MAVLCLVLVLVTGVGMAWFYYGFYVNTAQENIRDQCALLAQSVEESGASGAGDAQMKSFAASMPDARVTLIGADGTVLFDTLPGASGMENHATREEFVSALQAGSGEAMRESATTHAKAYYYALRLSDGSAIRLSRQVDSIWRVFADTLPIIQGLILLLLIAALVCANLLSRRIIEPVNAVALRIEGALGGQQSLEGAHAYDELEPFLSKIAALSEQSQKYVLQLQQERDTMSNITRNMREGLVLVDSSHHILSVNPSARSMLGASADRDYEGENVLCLSREPQFLDGVTAALEKGESSQFTRSEAGAFHRFYFSPVLSGQAVSGCMVFIVDVTSETRAELMRRDFAANVSHELKTPLTSISGFAEMVENGMMKSDADVKQAAARIHSEASRLLSLIGDILWISELESGREAPEEEVPLPEVVQQIQSDVHALAGEKGVLVEAVCKVPAIRANRRMVEEVLHNLVENAVKYNKQGGKVRLSIMPEGGCAVITVADTGIGIPLEHQSRVFERFYCVDKSRSKKTGGTGLGLSIVRHAVECMEGKISLQSVVGEGTTIVVRLPLQRGGAFQTGALSE